ncbi:hypothetical protein MCUN1_001601 [Malassezia cuniculi]|uniref:Large ribosomal subunit protein uL3m n=1 Tax=Malassezia cuniculi TaxID=948313 RepID=A0AAF0EUC3_9BASI|nr:hypothetical protein MCUN1_001601 [Malassezia cuniculi]
MLSRVCRSAARVVSAIRGVRQMASAAADGAAKADAPVWTPTSRRVGLITRKMGMTTVFGPDGRRIPATILYVDSNQVSLHVQNDGEGDQKYVGVQVAACDAPRENKITSAIRGHLARAGIQSPKRIIREFRVSPDALIPLGTHLSAAHFVPGQDVDCRAITRGKGFAGVMKRHGFAGGNASHGASLAHRTPGSIGNNQDPGRVFPGKRMPGRMGGRAHRTMQNMRVLRVDVRNELIFVKGPIPGPTGGVVVVRDAIKNLVRSAYFTYRRGRSATGELLDPAKGPAQYLPNGIVALPFPAGTRELAESLPDVIEATNSST